MHTGFVLSTFPALSQTFVDSQIRGLLRAGHDVTVCAYARPQQDLTHAYWRDPPGPGRLRVVYGARIPQTPWKRLVSAVLLAPRFWRHPLAYLRTLLRAPRGSFERAGDAVHWLLPLQALAGADAVVAHFGDVALRGITLRESGLACRRFVAFFHGADMTRFVDRNGPTVFAGLFAGADLCLPISDRWRERLVELGADPARVVVHRMGVDLARYAWQDRTLPDSGPVRLLSVARLVEKKGIEYALEAVAALPAALRARVDYRVAGDGPLHADLAARIQRLGIGAQVTLLGWQDQDSIATLVAESHLLLLPSVTASDGDQEGIPVSAMEAMATGLPVVATRHSGIPELVRDGENGWLVAERDAAGLAAAITGALAEPATYRRYAERSRQAIAEDFDEARLNASLERLLQPR